MAAHKLTIIRLTEPLGVAIAAGQLHAKLLRQFIPAWSRRNDDDNRFGLSAGIDPYAD